MGFFYRVIYLCYIPWCAIGGAASRWRGEGPPEAPEPPYPQGVAAGARPGGPSPGFRACRGAGGASAVRSWSARGASGRGCVLGLGGDIHMCGIHTIHTQRQVPGWGPACPGLPSWPFWRGVSRSGTGGPSRRGEGSEAGRQRGRVAARCTGTACGAGRCLPLRARGGGARRTGWAWSAAPGASPRRALCPLDGGVQSRSTCLCRAVRRPRGLGGCSSGRWGCRSVPPLGGAGGGRGTVVLLRQGPPSADVGGTSEGVAVGRAETQAMQGPDGGGVRTARGRGSLQHLLAGSTRERHTGLRGGRALVSPSVRTESGRLRAAAVLP